ncbi:glycosyltransferase family 4 protein [Nioella aestuarii]|uniref:glycosyltransferase family 4 protein n=1 Tax=Nioella aestuarii TaxID=1662864 RepID=UPI003D7FA3C9
MLPRRKRRVWHARRNIEMLVGIILRRIFRKNLALVFTSAAQRHHTGYTRWLIRQMERVIATSKGSASFLDVPSRVIMHGIDCTRFVPASDRASVRADLDLPENAFLIGCFGRVREQKGTDIFVQALIEAARDHPDLVGIVIGQTTSNNEPFLEELRARVQNAGLEDRILFLGEQPDAKLPSFFASLDLFIAPQRWEGFGLTPIEAMASGVPVLASTAGAFSEMVIEGETGHILDPMTPEALSTAIRVAAADRDRLRVMGQNARADVLERFNIEREAAEIEEVYQELLPEETAPFVAEQS